MSALWMFIMICTSSLQFLLLILKSFSDLLMHLSWLHEERCLRCSACKETWSDFIDLLTCLLFSEESAWWFSSASFLFLLCLLSLSWLYIFCKAITTFLWNIAFSLIILLLSHLLMTWFLMRNAYFSAFVTACLAVELISSVSVHSSWWMHSESYDVFLLIQVEDDASASLLLLFMNDLCSSLSLTLMFVLEDQ